MINKLTIYNFLNKHKYKLIIASAASIVIVTTTTLVLNADSEISYDNKGVTMKTIAQVTQVDSKENTTIPTTEQQINNGNYNNYEINTYRDYSNITSNLEVSTEDKEETTSVNVIASTELEETTGQVTEPVQTEVTTALVEPSESDDYTSASTEKSDYYVDPSGNYWNSYEEYQQYEEVLNGEVTTYTYTR